MWWNTIFPTSRTVLSLLNTHNAMSHMCLFVCSYLLFIPLSRWWSLGRNRSQFISNTQSGKWSAIRTHEWMSNEWWCILSPGSLSPEPFWEPFHHSKVTLVWSIMYIFFVSFSKATLFFLIYKIWKDLHWMAKYWQYLSGWYTDLLWGLPA